MPSIGSTTRTIRFNASDLGVIEAIMKKEDTSFNNAVHILIENGGTPKIDGKTSEGTPEKPENLSNGVHPKEPKEPKTDLEQIEEMANLMRVEPDKLIRDIKDMMEEGTLYYSDGKLRNPAYEEFENRCAEKKIPIDRVLSKIMQTL